jgi:hypothetical protein
MPAMAPTRPLASLLAASLVLGCAPIEVTTTHTLQPRSEPPLALGEQLVDRHFTAEFVQLGPRVLVELHALRLCSEVTHRPVMRIEQVERKAKGFIAWDFALAGAMGGLAATAFAHPQAFSPRLFDNNGRYIVDTTPAYVTGGIFAGIATLLLAAGIVNAIKARDETRYAAAYALELAPQQPCTTLPEQPLAHAELALELLDGELVVTATSDAEGRARFELPAWPEDLPPPEKGKLIAKLTIEGEPRSLALELRGPWSSEMVDAHTGHADTREADTQDEP